MAKKFYAVRTGRKPGIFYTWSDCQAQVTGYKGAEFKSFPTIEEAKNYLTNTNNIGYQSDTDDEPIILSSLTKAVAYVDGSYNDACNTFSYGAVIFWNNEEFQLSQEVVDNSLVEMRNVAGEICGAQAAMDFALEHNCTELTIYHDYAGISKWPIGEWKTNKEGTIAYKSYYDSIKDRLKVTFIKVKGHSNDKYNDLADELAKQAIF